MHPNLRYATDGSTAAAFEVACQPAGVGLQRHEHCADRPCGSTIGPLASARLVFSCRCRCCPTCDALGGGIDGCSRRGRLRSRAAGVFCRPVLKA
ncbi:hypothetical protein [Mycobacterium lepromatosis]|uniref:hypothetical protein n=1 Tax=Mycobacterium lepromatosis TaxID=480418 RepID=UPI003B50D5E5